MKGVADFLKGPSADRSKRNATDLLDDLCSHSGFVREDAVKALVSHPQRGTLSLLLLRLNDWVPQVRAVAKGAVRKQMQTFFLPDWIAAMETVMNLEQARREDHSVFLKEVALFLSLPEHLPAVMEATATASLRVRRFVFDAQWLAAKDDAGQLMLLEQALSGNDVVVASRALCHVGALVSAEHKRRVFRAACASPFAVARCGGVRWLVDHADPATDSLVHELGFDPSASVRWWCLRWFRSSDGLEQVVANAESVARDTGVSARQRRVALRWLLDADPEKALSVSATWLDDPLPSLRHEALSVQLMNSQGDEKVRWLQRAFGDPSPRVQKLLLHKAHIGQWQPSAAQFKDTFLRDPTSEGVRRFLTMRTLYSTWDRLECLLVVWPTGRELGCETSLLDALNRWPSESNACSYGPCSDQIQRLVSLWMACRHQLSDSLQQTIHSHLHNFGIL